MFNLIRKILFPLEFVSLLVTIVGIYLSNLEILMIGMATLAAVYFVRAFTPPELGDNGGKQRGLFDLLAGVIAMKVAWIASSVAIIGALFTILHLTGAEKQLLIGVVSLATSIIIMGIYVVIKPDGSRLFPVLYRAVPVCLFAIYMMMNKSI